MAEKVEKQKKRRGGKGSRSGGPLRDLKRPMNPKKLTPELIEAAAEVVREGRSISGACEEWNISLNTFKKWLKEPNPVGLVLELQMRLNQVTLSEWQESKIELDRAALEAATETRVKKKVVIRELFGMSEKVLERLEEIGDPKLIDEFAQCNVLLERETTIEEVLPDGNLALRIVKEQERRDEKEAERLNQKAKQTQKVVVAKRRVGAPGV